MPEMVDINAVDDWETSQPDVEQMDVHANRTKTCRMQVPVTDKDVETAESEDITWSGSGSDEGTGVIEPVCAQSANLRILKLRINFDVWSSWLQWRIHEYKVLLLRTLMMMTVTTATMTMIL